MKELFASGIPIARVIACLTLAAGCLVAAAGAEVKEYRVTLTDGSEMRCAIVANDPAGRRLQVQGKDQAVPAWIFYHKIRAISDESAGLDVTGQFVSTLPLSSPPTPPAGGKAAPAPPAPADQGLSTGVMVVLAILGTITLLMWGYVI